MRALVTGAGGFIGHHLVTYLVAKGYWVRGVDLEHPEFADTDADEFIVGDLRWPGLCNWVASDVDEVYHLAADMGGIGYITIAHADIARGNILMDAHMLEASRRGGVKRFFYASSACVYPAYRQNDVDLPALREEDAYPADAEPGYGWEKLWAEQLCSYYLADHGLQTRIARFHNVYGPRGTFQGGKEKAPAALCRKVALANDGDEIEVWGDGKQVRSFMFIDDCTEGIWRIAQSVYPRPLNLGTDEAVSIEGLALLILKLSGKDLRLRFDASKPQGVRGRNSDNTRLRTTFGWEPPTPLREGLARTYEWMEGMLR